MTIPSRTAPPPPSSSSSSSSSLSSTQSSSTTNNGARKKVAPPRPPPPRITTIKPSTSSRSIFPNLFGSSSRKSNRFSNNSKSNESIPKLLPPPNTINSTKHKTPKPEEDLLIDLNTPPGSPSLSRNTYAVQSSFDSAYESNPSTGTNSSPINNVHYEEIIDPFNTSDDWNDPFGETQKVKFESLSIRTTSFPNPAEHLDPLCNGKNFITRAPTISMPTIIRPVIKQKPVVESRYKAQKQLESKKEASIALNSTTSLNVSNEQNLYASVDEVDPDAESYGIAIYDFEAPEETDLPLKAGEKVYLIKQMDDSWFFGRNRNGCEGIFPINFIDVKIPIKHDMKKQIANVSEATNKPSEVSSHSSTTNRPKIRVLYNFNAEVAEDLTLHENEYVTVLYKINDEWLYGEIDNRRGQFPANFIEYIPDNL